LENDKVMIADLETMIHAKNYRNWMYDRLEPFIGQRVLEVGAGIGNFTELLLDRSLVVPTDKSEACVAYLKRRLNSPKVSPAQLDLENPEASALGKWSFDTVVCLNVLEHVKDDARALSYMSQMLVTGGRLVLLVPAFEFLYGSIDRAIDHHRRYTRKNLLPKMLQARFEIKTAFYMNVIGMAGWFWNNRIRRIGEEDAAQIMLFDRFVAPWAERIERAVPPPFGLSLIAIGQKS